MSDYTTANLTEWDIITLGTHYRDLYKLNYTNNEIDAIAEYLVSYDCGVNYNLQNFFFDNELDLVEDDDDYKTDKNYQLIYTCRNGIKIYKWTEN